MPNIKSAKKRVVIAEVNRLRNASQKSAIKTQLKKFDAAVKGLCRKYFPDLIDAAIGENEKLGIRKKPAPDTVNQVLKEFQIMNTQAVYVGDSEVDIQTAENANMKCISVVWGFKDRDFLSKHNARIIVNSPEEILTILENENR